MDSVRWPEKKNLSDLNDEGINVIHSSFFSVLVGDFYHLLKMNILLNGQ